MTDVADLWHVLYNEDTSGSALAELATHGDPDVRSAVARHQKTLPETLADLAKDPNEGVRWDVVNSLNTPTEAILLLAEDVSDCVRWHTIVHPNMPFEFLQRYVQGTPNERSGVARNLSTPVKMLEFLAKDSACTVRCEVIDNPNTPVALKAFLATHQDVLKYTDILDGVA